jgi:Ca-activated chloride channel homolog
MRRYWIHLVVMLSVGGIAVAQDADETAAPAVVEAANSSNGPAAGPYTLKVGVNEVSLPFHVADFHGVAIGDLTVADVRLLDNGKAPKQIVSFEVYRDLPIRGGMLIDTSRSVLENLRRNQQVSTEYVRQFLRRQTAERPGDEAFVMRFDSDTKVLQDWTGEGDLLAASIRNVALDHESRMGGTAIYDAVYKACRDQFGKMANVATGNFLLLFSDGLDNASHSRIEDDVDICQQTNTAIYVFSGAAKSMFIEGQRTLTDLAEQTGGRIFFEQNSDGVHDDLRLIEANLRTQYRMVYKPAKMKSDGSFHRIRLDSPNRGGVITARSGYYAARPGGLAGN